MFWLGGWPVVGVLLYWKYTWTGFVTNRGGGGSKYIGKFPVTGTLL